MGVVRINLTIDKLIIDVIYITRQSLYNDHYIIYKDVIFHVNRIDLFF